jgi:photosystem II stability/assembly factor-like uncharacterized protein
MSWVTISPDLTKDEKEKQELPGGPIQHDHTGVEVYNTVFALAESTHTKGEIWAGTDDGRIHITPDGGETWNEITPEDMPEDGTVNIIDLSQHQPGRAFAAVYRYRMDDFKPYVFRTDDFGKSWQLLTDGKNGIPDGHPVRVVREDPDRKGLLYAGTEFSMFVSFDDGKHWQSLQLNLPHVPITDLQVHRQDLVFATQGRSFWILDDLTPLHQVNDQAASADVFLYEPRDAYRLQSRGFRGGRAPDPRPNGAVVYYHLSEKPEEQIQIEILDAQEQVLRTFKSKTENGEDTSSGNGEDEDEEKPIPAKEGMNRFEWDLLNPKLEVIKGSVMSLGYTGGYPVAPGTYKARLTVGDDVQTKSFEVLKDPRLTDVTQDDLMSNTS